MDFNNIKKRREFKPPKGRFATVSCARTYGRQFNIQEKDFYEDNPKRNWFLHKKGGQKRGEYVDLEKFPMEKKFHPNLLRGKAVPALKKDQIFETNKDNKPAPKKQELKFHYDNNDKPLMSYYR
jgi:hypothetical protein